MKVFCTGDCHGRFKRFNNRNFDYDGCSVEDTFMIICGDFGGIFNSQGSTETKEEKYWLNWLATKPITFVVVGGNHENYTFIEQNYPIENVYGARVRKLRHNILWVERGEIIQLGSKKFWCFGGAKSTDQAYRKPEISWWSREEASEQEFEYGLKTFEDNWQEIDYIISHAAPAQVACQMPGCRGDSVTEMFLNRIWWYNQNQVPHFCGHIHHNFHYNYCGYNVTILYDQILELFME